MSPTTKSLLFEVTPWLVPFFLVDNYLNDLRVKLLAPSTELLHLAV